MSTHSLVRAAMLLLVGLALVGASGCLCGSHWSDFELHGKVGCGFAGLSEVVGIPLDIVAAPVTLPLGAHAASHDHGEMSWLTVPGYIVIPSACLEIAFYNIGAVVGYPFHLLFEAAPPRISRLWRSRNDVVSSVLQGWKCANPQCSRTEYAILCAASRRQWPPVLMWEHEGVTLRPWEPGAFGRRDRIPMWLAEEWKAWDQAGRPTGDRAEAGLVLACRGFYPSFGNERSTFWNRPPPFLDAGEVRELEDILGADGQAVAEHFKASSAYSVRDRWDNALLYRARRAWQVWVLDHGGTDHLLDVRFAPLEAGRR